MKEKACASPEERLLSALQFYQRPELTAAESTPQCATRTDEQEAARSLVEVVPAIVRRSFPSFAEQLGEASVEDAIQQAISKCRDGCSTARSVGEAVRFVQIVALNVLRTEQRRRRKSSGSGEELPSPQASPDESMEWAEQLACLRNACQRVLAVMVLQGHCRRVGRAKVFLDYRLNPGRSVPQNDGSEESVRARNRVYKDRSQGRRYVADLIDENASRFSPNELSLLQRMLAAPELSEEPDLADPSEEEAP